MLLLLLAQVLLLIIDIIFLGNHSGGGIHFSIDDTILIFKDLTEKQDKYSSIFDNYTLGFLKKMHDEYGMSVSMYCWYEDNDGFDLSSCSKKYKQEFENHSDWLKFNFHSFNSDQDLKLVDYSTFVSQFDLFKYSLEEIVGNKSWDSFTRLHLFHGNQDIISYMVSNGINGFYTADDNRTSYGLNDNEMAVINNDRILNNSGTIYKKTDIRLDNSDNVFYEFYKFKWNDVTTEVFTHEWLLNTPKSKSIFKIEEMCSYSKHYNITFGF